MNYSQDANHRRRNTKRRKRKKKKATIGIIILRIIVVIQEYNGLIDELLLIYFYTIYTVDTFVVRCYYLEYKIHRLNVIVWILCRLNVSIERVNWNYYRYFMIFYIFDKEQRAGSICRICIAAIRLSMNRRWPGYIIGKK